MEWYWERWLKNIWEIGVHCVCSFFGFGFGLIVTSDYYDGNETAGVTSAEDEEEGYTDTKEVRGRGSIYFKADI